MLGWVVAIWMVRLREYLVIPGVCRGLGRFGAGGGRVAEWEGRRGGIVEGPISVL